MEDYFDRHGGKTILIGRFIGLVRAVSPFVAGSSGLAYRRFFPYSVIGCGLWATLFTVLGYIFYRSFDRVAAVAGQAALGFGVTIALHRRGDRALPAAARPRSAPAAGRAWVQRQAERPALRPVAAAVRPVWRTAGAPVVRFVRPRFHLLTDRLTPGELGLELTTAIAVAGVGAYVFVLYTSIVSGDVATVTGGDRELLRLADDLRSDVAVDIAKVVTDLGSFVIVVALVFAVALALLARGRFVPLVALVLASIVIVFAVDIAKAAIDRPRPSNPLQATEGSSFPSGHAAYSVIWVAAALLVARVAMPGLARDTALVGFAVLVAIAIGLSRVYLRLHYWSDVAAGWGLGAAILATAGSIALVVEHLRQNQAREP